MFRQRLSLDFADALAALGKNDQAEVYWEKMAASSPADSLAGLIAKARTRAPNGGVGSRRLELQTAVERAKGDPSSGELVRRASWTLKVLERSKTN